MCGYCIEGAVVLSFVEYENTNAKFEFENQWVKICLQESRNIPDTIRKIKSFHDFSLSIDIAFCRIWELLLNQESDEEYRALINEFSAEAINDFLITLRNIDDYKIWEPLGNANLYTDRHCWENFARNKIQLINNSVRTLNTYYNWWILEGNKEISDPQKRMEETGIMDPIEDTTPKDWNRFYQLFPVVYFSVLILSKYQKNCDIIKRIALENSHEAPAFNGYELWLQRKALTCCVREYGAQFILDNYDNIRLELIYYCLITESFSIAEITALKEHLTSYDHWIIGIDTKTVLQLLDTQFKSLS